MPKDLNFHVAQVAGALAVSLANANQVAEAAQEQLGAKDAEIAALKARIVEFERPPAE